MKQVHEHLHLEQVGRRKNDKKKKERNHLKRGKKKKIQKEGLEGRLVGKVGEIHNFLIKLSTGQRETTLFCHIFSNFAYLIQYL